MKSARVAPPPALASALLVFTLAVSGFGCGDEDTMAPQETPKSTKTVTVTVSQAYVIATCENAADNPGDFTFEVELAERGVAQTDWQRFGGDFSGLANQTVDIPDIVMTMEREPESGDWFQVIFHVTEWDGANVVDDRMNDSMGAGYHAWTSDDDWDNGAHSVTVSGSTECRVNLIYSVDVD